MRHARTSYYRNFPIRETILIQLRKSDIFYAQQRSDYISLFQWDIKLEDLVVIPFRPMDERIMLYEQTAFFTKFDRSYLLNFNPQTYTHALGKLLTFLQKKLNQSSLLTSDNIFKLIITFNTDLYNKLIFYFNNSLNLNDKFVLNTYLTLLRKLVDQCNYLNNLLINSGVYTKFNKFLPDTFLFKKLIKITQFDSSIITSYQNYLNTHKNMQIIIPINEVSKKTFLSIFFLQNSLSSRLFKNTSLTKQNFSIINDKNTSIFFIRNQRRYNKRRYSRVRAYSRPPFFSGIILSTVFAAMFFSGSMKSVD